MRSIPGTSVFCSWKKTWGRLWGGISVALALSIPAGEERDVIVAVTCVIVAFSILVQGLSIGRLVKATARHSDPADQWRLPADAA